MVHAKDCAQHQTPRLYLHVKPKPEILDSTTILQARAPGICELLEYGAAL